MDCRYTIEKLPDWMIYLVGGLYFARQRGTEMAGQALTPHQ